MAAFINNYLEQYYDELEPIEFYRELFPKGELETRGHKETGKYHAIAVELLPKAKDSKKNVKRYIIYDDFIELKQLLKSDNFIILSPISYIGTSRKSENARYIHALAIDLDGIETESNIIDLFHQMSVKVFGKIPLPTPTFVVSSGNGLHLYFQFEKPIPCFVNIVKQLQRLKKDLTRSIWNSYITTLSDSVQYESLFQGFRLGGGITKNGDRTRIFETGKKVSIEYLNEFVIDSDNRVIDYTYKSNLTLPQAKEKYPEWYEKRIIQKQPRGTWTTKKDLFYWWLNRLKNEARVGHRYYAVMCLAVYAKKSGIDREELEEIAFDLVEQLDSISDSEENHFTRADVLAALEMYNDNYITFPIDSITRLTQIPIEKNKRNGRTRKANIDIVNNTRKFRRDVLGENEYKGRPKGSKNKVSIKSDIIKEWRKNNPRGSKSMCIDETGISKPTVYKYWN